jgi:hypothetical protein
MIGVKNILILTAFIATVGSCNIGNESCCYNVRLEYRYQRYGTLGSNELGFYISSLKEYVFDGNDVLIKINDYRVPHGAGDFYTEQELKPGRYTVITIGNKGENERVDQEMQTRDAQTRDAQVGLTTKQHLLLTLYNPQPIPQGVPYDLETPHTQGRSDRLYYGYRSFSVGAYGVSRISIDMTHGHCVLGLTVTWKDNSGHPKQNEEYTFILEQVPSEYHFVPEFLVNNGIESGEYEAEKELYPLRDHRRVNYIPLIDRSDPVSHTAIGTINGKTLYGQFVTFRYRNDGKILLSIWSRAEQVMKKIDLNLFFRDMGIDLNHSLFQEYNLQIEIDGDTVRIGLVRVDDWEDGGEL